MAEFDWRCNPCKLDDTVDRYVKTHKCPQCGKKMYQVYTVNVASRGDYNFVSQSLAMHPDQIAEHNQMFPGVKVRGDGCPEFTSYRQHDRYLEKIGVVKRTQKIRSKRPGVTTKVYPANKPTPA